MGREMDPFSGDSGSRCILCRGTRMMCGKDRCPVLVQYYANVRAAPAIDALDIAGNSPPSVFIGRYGYPKVNIGPMVPPPSNPSSGRGRRLPQAR